MTPDYVAQTGEHWPEDDFEAYRDWVRARCAEADGKGCKIGRVSVDPDKKLVLVEGWYDRLADQSVEPEWQLVAA